MTGQTAENYCFPDCLGVNLSEYRLEVGKMDKGYGSDFISITDDDGNEFELEHIDTIEEGGETYMVFLPADMDVDDDDYGVVILKAVEEDGEEVFRTVDDDDELRRIHDIYLERLFDEEEE